MELSGLTEVVSRQQVLAPVVAEYLKQIEYAGDGWAARVVSPATPRPIFVADPLRWFGQPIFLDGAARVEDVVDRWRAGDPLTEVTADFGVAGRGCRGRPARRPPGRNLSSSSTGASADMPRRAPRGRMAAPNSSRRSSGSREEEAPDTEWLEFCGNEGLIVLTKDQRIRYRPAEIEVVVRFVVKMFALANRNLKAEEQADRFIRHRSRLDAAALENGPFIYAVQRERCGRRDRAGSSAGMKSSVRHRGLLVLGLELAEPGNREGCGGAAREGRGSDLIWRVVCQELTVRSRWCGASAEGAAGLAGARRLVRLISAGWVPQDRVSS